MHSMSRVRVPPSVRMYSWSEEAMWSATRLGMLARPATRAELGQDTPERRGLPEKVGSAWQLPALAVGLVRRWGGEGRRPRQRMPRTWPPLGSPRAPSPHSARTVSGAAVIRPPLEPQKRPPRSCAGSGNKRVRLRMAAAEHPRGAFTPRQAAGGSGRGLPRRGRSAGLTEPCARRGVATGRRPKTALRKGVSITGVSLTV